jgi:hypothetical protein
MGNTNLLKDVGNQNNLHPPNLRKTLVMGLDLDIDSHSSSLVFEGKVRPFIASMYPI